MVQSDTDTRSVEISLTNNGEVWTPGGLTGVFVRYRKGDGTCGIYDTLPNGKNAWTAEKTRSPSNWHPRC